MNVDKTEGIEMPTLGLNDDAAKRSPGLHWPAGFSPDEEHENRLKKSVLRIDCSTN
jgi:hypothetical protein